MSTPLNESLLNSSERAADILRDSDRDEQTQSEDIYELPPVICLNTQRYEGATTEGQFSGTGVASFQGGHEYKGIFSKGFMNGLGTFTQANGVKYEGDFVCNVPMGQGTYTWLDGSTYVGDVCRGIRQGMGTYECARHGVSYRGQWHRGKRHGKGTVYYNKDKMSWYDGDWVMNKREGWGERCYPSGNIYTGEWKNNLRHGEGTMNWIKLKQQYVGNWQNGIQHGSGTHIWLLKRVDGSQYVQSNQYKGSFFEGWRHGEGTFYYASGASYTGEWRNDKKHGEVRRILKMSVPLGFQGQVTTKSGRVFKCLFDEDVMIANLNEEITPIPVGILPLSDSDSSILGPDMAFNIEVLLEKIPKRNREAENKQVESVVLNQQVELRLIYSFYSRLGRFKPPDNIFLLSRLQFWRLLKDCNIHHHGVTLTQIERFIREEGGLEGTCSPFASMQLHEFLRGLVTVAYYIYRNVLMSKKNFLAACLSRLMMDDVFPNARNKRYEPTVIKPPCSHEVNEFYNWIHDMIKLRYRRTQRFLMNDAVKKKNILAKDLRLFDHHLTTTRLLELITAEICDCNNQSSCVELEIAFLEFFEVLLGCAELKFQQVSGAMGQGLDQIS
ncbi:radial spoke head 10 homolog B [Anableps anableps]